MKKFSLGPNSFYSDSQTVNSLSGVTQGQGDSGFGTEAPDIIPEESPQDIILNATFCTQQVLNKHLLGHWSAKDLPRQGKEQEF